LLLAQSISGKLLSMLKIISSQNPRQSAQLLAENFEDIQKQKITWLISDLKSKFEIQKSLMDQYDFLNAESVLRASELWKLLLFRVYPEWQVISREFAISLISQFIKDLKKSEIEELGVESKIFQAENQGFANTIYNYITQLMPALSHPMGIEIITDWLEENPDCQTRWGKWFLLSSQIWNLFLKEKYVAAPWTSGVLVNELGIENLWTRSLVVDLGSELSQVESEVLIMLSKFVDVTVIQPNPEWSKIYASTLNPYKRLHEYTDGIESYRGRKSLQEDMSVTNIEVRANSKIVFKKFTTELAEIKNVCAQIRQKLDQGILASQIAIIAPDIDEYFLALSSYLKIEGISFNRDEVACLNQFREMNQWLAQMRLRLGLFNESDLEISLFNKSERPHMKFEQFTKLFKFVYSRDDLSRDAEIENLFRIDLDLKAQVSRDLFFTWSLKFLPADIALEKLDALFKKIWAEIPIDQNLSVDLWLNYLQALISKTNLKIVPADVNGVQILNLSSCEHTSAQVLFVMGMSEEAFRTQFQTALTAFDISKLAQDFGFQIYSTDQKRAEFQARWILNDPHREVSLTYAVTDLSGQILSPSWLWLEGAQKSEHSLKVEVPELTRWDEIQSLPLEKILELRLMPSTEQKSLLDILNFKKPNVELRNSVYLSASSIESFLKCPFIYQATRLFKLGDQPSLDLDIDHMTKGTLIHKIFEKLTKPVPMKLNYSDSELEQIIDQAKIDNLMLLGDERLWLGQKKRYLKIAKRFLEFEKIWRNEFPKTQTKGQEIKVCAQIDPVTFEFSKLEENPDVQPKITFRGSIDRLDVDGHGQAVVIDYKSTASSVSQFTSWLKNDKLQLLLYVLAIENAWTKLESHKVVSAVYYVVQNMNRDFGFKMISDQSQLYALGDSKRNKIEKDALTLLLKEAYVQTQQTISKILSGDFTPAPKNRDDCSNCKWRELCRAPHLSQ
jgi:ATP-dependent helicase/nuclease subunit B